jgi:hypothetical protein
MSIKIVLTLIDSPLRIDADHPLTVRDVVGLTVEPDRAHFFDRETGERIASA